MCSSGSEDDEDMEACLLICIGLFYNRNRTAKRKPVILRKRLCLEYQVQLLLEEGQFERYYRMSSRSFELLLCLIAKDLVVNDKMSFKRTRCVPITPANKLQMVICWLVGGNYNQVRMAGGCSVPFFYTVVWQVVDAINKVQDLALVFPLSIEDLNKTAAQFRVKSSDQFMTNCIGCIDGWLCRIDVPSKNTVADQKSFYSGHYSAHGVNVQACVDARCCFTAFSCNSPGGMGDALAFENWGLKGILENLVSTHSVFGDNAYVQSMHCMTPFTKPELNADSTGGRSVFNFLLSQLRIRVEMAFGLLVNKWRLLKKNLRVKIGNIPRLLHCLFRLHNFCIIQNTEANPEYEAEKEVEDIISQTMNSHEEFWYLSTHHEIKNDESNICIGLGHRVRDIMVESILRLGLKRSDKNIKRNYARKDL